MGDFRCPLEGLGWPKVIVYAEGLVFVGWDKMALRGG